MKSADPIAEGQLAPDFALPASNGKSVSLRDFRGKSNVVLYFYPKDNTPGCTREACDFRDRHAELKKAETVVLGVSKDSIKSHEGFTRKFGLPFTLLSDPDGSVCNRYGVIKDKTLYGKVLKGVERTTFVIDKTGVVRRIFPKVKVDGHIEEVLQFIQEHL